MKHARRLALLAFALPLPWQSDALAKDLSHKDGKELYQRLCSSCHGERGQGDGIVGTYFKLQPPDLTTLAQRNGGQFPADYVRRIIDGRETLGAHGAREMPIWGLALHDTDAKEAQQERQVHEMIDRLTEHLRSIQR